MCLSTFFVTYNNAVINILSFVYLAFALLGAILPTLANVDFFNTYEKTFDIGLFIQLANVNAAAHSIEDTDMMAKTLSQQPI